MITVGAFSTGLDANACQPLVGAGGRVTRLAAGFTFPADRVDVGSAAEQAAKEGDFLGCAKS